MSEQVPTTAACRHGETEPHHFTADDYPVPGLWWCAGPDGDQTDSMTAESLQVCAKVGCNEPATVEMSQPDPWALLWKGEGNRWFCSSCAVKCEQVGGVRA